MKIRLSLVKSILTVSSLVAVASITLETKPAAAACLSQPCVTVEVEGIKYDVSYKTGYLSDLESELMNQVWWGNENLTRSFAETVGLLLGTSDIGRHFGDYGDYSLVSGPIFAYHFPFYKYGMGMSAWNAPITWREDWIWMWGESGDSGDYVYTRVNLGPKYLGVYDYEFSDYNGWVKQFAVASPSAVPEPLTLGGTLLALVAGKIARRRLKQR